MDEKGLLPPPEEVLEPVIRILEDFTAAKDRIEPVVRLAELSYDVTRLFTSIVKIPYEAITTAEKMLDILLKGK
jgi:hypothetical protein